MDPAPPSPSSLADVDAKMTRMRAEYAEEEHKRARLVDENASAAAEKMAEAFDPKRFDVLADDVILAKDKSVSLPDVLVAVERAVDIKRKIKPNVWGAFLRILQHIPEYKDRDRDLPDMTVKAIVKRALPKDEGSHTL